MIIPGEMIRAFGIRVSLFKHDFKFIYAEVFLSINKTFLERFDFLLIYSITLTLNNSSTSEACV
jgi:hypothetical protein